MKIQHEHVVSIAKERVLQIYLDDQFYIGQLKNSGAITVNILESSAIPGGGVSRKTRVTQPTKVPAMLRKSDTDEYIDDCRVDVSQSRMSYRITPSMFADQFNLAGSIDFIEFGPTTRLVFTTEIEIRIPLLGRKLEQQSIDEAEGLVQKQVDFLKAWAAR